MTRVQEKFSHRPMAAGAAMVERASPPTIVPQHTTDADIFSGAGTEIGTGGGAV